MKHKALLISLCLLACYVAGFVYVRSAFRATGTVSKPNAAGTGYLPAVGYTNTHVWIPGVGMSRWSRLATYWLYRPVGYIDERITGREYYATDERRIMY